MLKRIGESPADELAAFWGADEKVRASGPDRLPVLLIVHQHHSNPGHVGNWLSAHGFPLDIRRPRYGDPLPETLDAHAGAVIFGGPQSANDTDDFVRSEIDWIRVPLEEEKPFLGICLGAQMLARHLGGDVGFHPDGFAEVGYYPLRPTEEGRTQFDWPSHVYQWHREGFTAPGDAALLAESDIFGHQAFRYGPAAFGIQFHPEITHHLVNRWTARATHRLVLPGARPGPEHISGHLRFGPGQRRWLDAFLTRWTGFTARQDKTGG